MKEERYAIAWRNRRTGQSGQGSMLFSEEQAELICSVEGKDHPEIEYSPALIAAPDDGRYYERQL